MLPTPGKTPGTAAIARASAGRLLLRSGGLNLPVPGGRGKHCNPKSCPVSSCRLVLVVEQGLERTVAGGVVCGFVLPAAPDDE